MGTLLTEVAGVEAPQVRTGMVKMVAMEEILVAGPEEEAGPEEVVLPQGLLELWAMVETEVLPKMARLEERALFSVVPLLKTDSTVQAVAAAAATVWLLDWEAKA